MVPTNLIEADEDSSHDDDTLVSHLEKLKNKTNTNQIRQDKLQKQLDLMETYLSGPIYTTLKNLETINQQFKFKLSEVDTKLTSMKSSQAKNMDEI